MKKKRSSGTNGNARKCKPVASDCELSEDEFVVKRKKPLDTSENGHSIQVVAHFG